MAHLGSHWTDFHEVWCKHISKFLEKIEVSLESKKNNKYFA